MKKRHLLTAALVGGMALAALAGVVPANAATATPSLTDTAAAQSTTTSYVDSSCVAAITAARAANQTDLTTDVCKGTVTLSTTAAQPVTVADVASAKGSLSASAYQSLVTAAAAGAVVGKGYSQGYNNVTDRETQSGYFYYDGSHAWVTQSYRGKQGNHQCLVSWTGGYYVANTQCEDTGSTSQRNLTGVWQISVGVKGSPIAWTETHTMFVNSTGRVWS